MDFKICVKYKIENKSRGFVIYFYNFQKGHYILSVVISTYMRIANLWRIKNMAKIFVLFPLLLFVSLYVHAENVTRGKTPIAENDVVVHIHHCTSCGFRRQASQLAEDIKKELDIEVNLVAGDIGSFDVYVNETLIFSKVKAGRFPESDEIIQRIREYERDHASRGTGRIGDET
jgi:selenoprotein W-related protein